MKLHTQLSVCVSEATYTQQLLGSCKYTDLVLSHMNMALCLEGTVDIWAKNMMLKLQFQDKLNYGVFWTWITPRVVWKQIFVGGFLRQDCCYYLYIYIARLEGILYHHRTPELSCR